MKATGFSRVSKNSIISQIEKEIKSHPTFFVARHDTVSATTLDKLRAKLRQSNSRYLVVKKSLGKKALEKANLKNISEVMDGACGIAFTSGDPVTSSKILVDFSKENQGFMIQTGYMDGQVMGADQIKILASLPSKEVLLARIAGGVKTPIARVAMVTKAIVAKVAMLVEALAKKKGSGQA